MKRGKIKYYFLIVFIIIFLIFIFSGVVTWAPKDSEYISTKIKIDFLEQNIMEYFYLHKSLPSSLNEIPMVKSVGHEIKDTWGRAIIYKVKNGEVFLISYGADGAPGGTQNDKDIVRHWIPTDN